MKVDPKRQIASYSARAGRFDVVTVPPLQYVMVDGRGDPNAPGDYEQALRTIYPLAYALKFLSKQDLDRDYVVPPLEALWWSDDMTTFTTNRDASRWSWTLMILAPEWITSHHLAQARAAVERKGGAPMLDAARLESLEEGLCVQTLHVGPYDAEGPVLATMHDEFIPAQDLRMTGRHHEIYLGDPRRVAPEKLRTILRQPVARS